MAAPPIAVERAAALWELVVACRAGEPHATAAAERAALAFRATSAPWSRFAVVDGELLVDGDAVAASVATYATIRGLVGFLQEARMAAVSVASDVSTAALRDFVRQAVDGDRSVPMLLPAGIEVAFGQRPVAAPAHATVPAQSSTLRATFVQHHLVRMLPVLPGVEPEVARLVVGATVDRLLAAEGGLECLLLLQEEDELLQSSIAVAVFTVLFARAAGWPEDVLADLGAAGLLHRIGDAAPLKSSSTSAFRWLAERGADDLWLRCALAADASAAGGAEAFPGVVPGGVAFVVAARCAVAALAEPAERREAAWRRAFDEAGLPEPLVDVARAVFAAGS